MNKKNFFILILLLLLNQINYLSADPSMEIPDDIVDDWDEALIEKERVEEEQFEQSRIEYQYKSYQQKKSVNKSLKVKKTYKIKNLKKDYPTSAKIYTQDLKLKPYKSPLQKPVLYQKIYINNKNK